MILESKKGPIELPCMDVILVPTEKVIANNYNNNVPIWFSRTINFR